jgi:hypothetical protein
MARQVWLRELAVQARELQLMAVLRARVLLPQAPAHVELEEPPRALEPLASPPPVGAPAQPEEQREPLQEPVAAAKRPSPQLLSPSVRLPPRFRRPLHPADDA